MCGIAGYLADPGVRPRKETLVCMCDRLRHRGPDGEGYFHDEYAGLGHRRLSIIDVEGGAQPLGNEDGSIQVVFNGEIYNFQQLRRGLIEAGHRFKTNTDTEVLVHLYEETGEALPEHLNGMFAFAIWDSRQRKLFLARDRFGEKPLYYSSAIAGMRFCFASELKALASLPGFPRKVNPRSVADFLNFAYIPDPETIYEDVFKLEPGRCLTVTENGLRKRRYWKPEFSTGEGADFGRAREQFRELAQDAVQMRLVSDVPLGAFLSGGVDSGSVVAFMARRATEQVRTFSIGFTDRQFDERYYARLVATRYQTRHEEKVVTPNIADVAPVLVEHYDEPFADSSAIPTLYLARMTRRGVTVALSGDGADELFGGYRRYLFALFEHRLRSVFPRWLRKSVFAFGACHYPKFDYLPRVFRAQSTLRGIAADLPEAYYGAMSYFHGAALDRILSPELRASLEGYSSKQNYCDRFKPHAHLPALQQMQAVDLETYLPGDILVKVDRATMAYSLESRAPWLDHRIGELACGLPASFKVRRTTGKYILKRGVSPYLPAELLTRKKMGFAIPLAAWFRSELKPLFEKTVLRPSMERYISLAEAQRLWREHQAGLRNHQGKLWNLAMLSCWDLRHREGREPEAIAALLKPD